LSEFLVLSYIFVAPRPGRFALDSVKIKVGEQEYRVGSVLVEVVQDPSHRVPFELEWVLPTGPFHVGEAIPLEVVAKDVRALKAPEAVRIEPTALGILEKVPELFGVAPEQELKLTVERMTWVYTPIARYLYTPFREGTHYIPSVLVRIEGIEQKLEGTRIPVLPLPQEVQRGSGAVGSFSIRATLDESTLGESATTTLRIRIEGKGNLHWLKVPTVRIEDCRVIYKGRRTHYRPTWEGYEGWVE
jgi:hypothetical protein